MKLPRYPKYKSSGVDWLGDVPEGWFVCAPKWRIRSSAGGTLIKGTCADEPADGLFPGFSASGQNIWLENYTHDSPGIVLSAVGARCGKTFKADGKWGVVANTHCLFPRQNADRDYLWYLTNQEEWWEKGGSAQPFVRVDKTLARLWVFPPLVEQKAIVDFLDRETGKIDELVAEQRRLMGLLKEKRQAVISQSVNQGLNPHVPMKPSGVEWLGDVPEGWQVKRLMHSAGLLTQKTRRRDHSIGLENIESWSGRLIQTETTFEGEGIAFNAGDILFGKLRPYLAKAYLAKSPGEAVGDFHVMRPLPNVDGRFLHYQILSPEFISIVDGSTFGSKMPRASWQFVGGMKVTRPPLAEQKAIVEFLETEHDKIDTLTAEAQRNIDLLQERRTALISAAITGQIDVRNSLRN